MTDILKLHNSYLKIPLLLFCLFLFTLTIKAQTSGDSILSHERKIDRPITLHGGQLQFNPAYEISIISKEYNNDSKKIILADVGTASVLHRYFFELNYGILDFLQASITLNYAERGERHESQLIWISETEPYLDVTYFDDYKGFEDLFLGALIKVPLKTGKIEIAFSPGFSLPIFSNNPEEPENSIVYFYGGYPITKIIYHNNHKTGNGSNALKIGTSVIVRPGNDFSIFAKLNYSWPVSESKTTYWIHQLDGSTFYYDDIQYKYLIGNTLDFQADLSYQAISWFNVSLSLYHRKTSSGWSEITGLRIGNPVSELSLLSIGYEIKATANLWINQNINVPITGKNQRAGLSIYLGISYNLFPFNRNRESQQTAGSLTRN